MSSGSLLGRARKATAGLIVLPLVGLAFSACSGDDDHPSSLAGSSSGAGTGGSRSSSSGSGGTANVGGEAGAEGSSPGAGCGDSQLAAGEECDGSEFGTATCADFGFDDGELSCSSDCTIRTDDCSGIERCADGRDNDGDGDVDCGDLDCEDACLQPCDAPETIDDPAEIIASTWGRQDVATSLCSESSAEPGPDVAYRLVAKHTGTLELEVASSALMHVTVSSTCAASAAESSCSTDLLSLPVTAGDELYVIVESHTPADTGDFELRVLSRENDVCGDGFRDPGEACDDHNLESLDGCDANCEVESEEDEPNDDASEAGAYSDGYFATIDPEGDVDVIEVTLPVGPASITATILGVGDDCERRKTDSFLELLDQDGTTVLDSDDDSGVELCSRLLVTGLDAGTYYLRVSASDKGDTLAFPYELLVQTNRCGDGVRGPGEQCDDGNQDPGDGCDASCQD